MTTRQEKVNSLIQRQISEYLLEEKPEEITGLLTITAVDVSADLEHAKVFFSIVGQKPELVEGLLNKHLYEIQGNLYKTLAMRKIPRIKFIADSSGEYANYISKILKDL